MPTTSLLPHALLLARALLLALLLTTSAQAQWSDLAPASAPAPRRTTIVHDSVRGEFVVFGGHSSINGWFGDTWRYSFGSGWSTQNLPVNPASRRDHAMAFDSLRGVAVLFGGQFSFGGSFYQDTWEWNGTGWTSVATSTLPARRADHAMAFDSARGVTVMFGGLGGLSANVVFQDTWEFDGTDWTQVSPSNSPSARYLHAMTYDAQRGVVVLFGGFASGGSQNDTWEYDGQTWTQVTPKTSPPARNAHALAYDASNAKVVLFGGTDGLARNDTWVYDATDDTWLLSVTATPPSPRHSMNLAFDPAAQTFVTFGGRAGNGNIGSTWGFDTTATMTATATTYGNGCGSPPLGLQPATRPTIGGVACATITDAPTAIGGCAIGFSNTVAFPVQLPFDLSSLGFTGCDLNQSNQIFGLPWTLAPGQDPEFRQAIPALLSALGMHLYVQAYALAPGENPAQVVVSNGLDWRLGNY